MTALMTDALKHELSALYRAGDRHYHGLDHIEALLRLAQEYRDTLSDFEAVEAAIWFHDAIYDSRAKDNEAKSAELARQLLAGRCDAARLDRIAGMIEATATHTAPEMGSPEADRDAALLLDMDLSILGAGRQGFDAYEDAVRQEYSWVPEADWIAGRGAVLETFLAREHLFHTAEFRNRYEAQARDNMRRSLAALGRLVR